MLSIYLLLTLSSVLLLSTTYLPQYLEATQSRHLNIEEDEVRFHPVDSRYRFDPILTFRNHFHFGIMIEVLPDDDPCRLFIVNNDYFFEKLKAKDPFEPAGPVKWVL